MSDIVTRLRDRAYANKGTNRLLEEAADVIERLMKQADDLRASYNREAMLAKQLRELLTTEKVRKHRG